MSYHTYLETLATEEIAHRTETRIARAVHRAHFPFLRTIDDFNFTFQTALKLQMLGSYLGPELVSDGRSAIFSGPSGTGKSHLAIAIAYRAIQHGYDARFVGADSLIGDLSGAARAGRLDAALTPYLQPHVLVIDELGYLSHAADAANVLCRVINERYLHRGSILMTTNKPLAAWATSCMTGTWPRPFLTDCSRVAYTTLSAGARIAPATSTRRTVPPDARRPPKRPHRG